MGPRRGQGPGFECPALPPPNTPGGTPPPSLKVPPAAFPGAQYAPLCGAFYSNCTEHARQLSGGGAHPQKKPGGAGRNPAPAKPPGCQAPGPPVNLRDPKAQAHPEQWGEVQRCSPPPPPHPGYLRNPFGEQGALELQRDLVCPISQPKAAPQLPDPGRPLTVGPFQIVMGLLLKHAPPGRMDYVQPCHL